MTGGSPYVRSGPLTDGVKSLATERRIIRSAVSCPSGGEAFSP